MILYIIFTGNVSVESCFCWVQVDDSMEIESSKEGWANIGSYQRNDHWLTQNVTSLERPRYRANFLSFRVGQKLMLKNMCSYNSSTIFGESGTEFNIKLHKQRKDVTGQYTSKGNSFNMNPKFILIEKVNQRNLDKLTLWKRLKISEIFRILKLETLHPKGLNKELNKI